MNIEAVHGLDCKVSRTDVLTDVDIRECLAEMLAQRKQVGAPTSAPAPRPTFRIGAVALVFLGALIILLIAASFVILKRLSP